MILAGIDIGSNSIRYLVGRRGDLGIEVITQGLRTTRLGLAPRGEALFVDGMALTIEAINEFLVIFADYAIDKIRIFATSAVREASNGAEFVADIFNATGLEVEILTGKEEAYFSFLGATSFSSACNAVIDIGGGSTELFYRGAGEALQGNSVPVGAVRLKTGEVSTDEALGLLNILTTDMPTGLKICGVGGTITSLGVMKLGLTTYSREALKGVVITREDLQNFSSELAGISAKERETLYPLLGKRADIIIEGIFILLALMEKVNVDEIIPSDAGIIDGILLEN